MRRRLAVGNTHLDGRDRSQPRRHVGLSGLAAACFRPIQRHGRLAARDSTRIGSRLSGETRKPLRQAKATRLRFRVDIDTLAERSADTLEMNGIASVEFETTQPLFFDSYERNRVTGSLILIDPVTNATVGAAMIREALPDPAGTPRAGAFERRHAAATEHQVTLEERVAR